MSCPHTDKSILRDGTKHPTVTDLIETIKKYDMGVPKEDVYEFAEHCNVYPPPIAKLLNRITPQFQK